jgi:hypothetical protein
MAYDASAPHFPTHERFNYRGALQNRLRVGRRRDASIKTLLQEFN